jgi:hypothetical protein
MKFLHQKAVEEIIDSSPDSKNNRFLKASHNLWMRFHNYEKQLPMALMNQNIPVCIHFATFNKNLYTNSYEIVTIHGYEGKGYATQLWEEYMDYAVNVRGMQRLKNSCVPTSVSWHVKNGLIFWAVDPTGSLKTDQPLYPTIQAQREAREVFIKHPQTALPSVLTVYKLKKHQLKFYSFGERKNGIIKAAIRSTGKYWMAKHLG